MVFGLLDCGRAIQMSEMKRCQWCNDLVNAEKCFASQMPFGIGWYCEICAKPVILTEAEDEHSPSQPLGQQE